MIGHEEARQDSLGPARGAILILTAYAVLALLGAILFAVLR